MGLDVQIAPRNQTYNTDICKPSGSLARDGRWGQWTRQKPAGQLVWLRSVNKADRSQTGWKVIKFSTYAVVHTTFHPHGGSGWGVWYSLELQHAYLILLTFLCRKMSFKVIDSNFSGSFHMRVGRICWAGMLAVS